MNQIDKVAVDQPQLDKLRRYSSFDYKLHNLSKSLEEDNNASAPLNDHHQLTLRYLINNAIDYYQDLDNRQILDDELTSHLADLHLLVGNYNNAIQLYHRLLNKSERWFQQSKILFGLGICYFSGGATQSAFHCLQQIYKLDGENFVRIRDLRYLLGVIYRYQKRYQEAIKHLMEAKSCTSVFCVDDSEIELQIGLCYHGMKDIMKCIQTYRSLLNRYDCPSIVKATACRNLGVILYNQNAQDLNQAKDAFCRSIHYYPGNSESFYLLGRCYADRDNKLKAIDCYKKSLKIKETNATVWCCLGILQQQLDHYHAAMESYIRALEVNSKHNEAWLNLGNLYTCVNQIQDATECYKRARLHDDRAYLAKEYARTMKQDDIERSDCSLPPINYFLVNEGITYRPVEEYENHCKAFSVSDLSSPNSSIQEPNTSNAALSPCCSKSMTESDLSKNGTSTYSKYSKLQLSAPVIEINDAADAHSEALAEWCLSPDNPITIIRGMTTAIGMDLDLFSSQSLASRNGDDQIEVRSQRQQTSEENWDSHYRKRVWHCESSRAHTTIKKYARYQASLVRDFLYPDESLAASPACSDVSSNSGQGSRGNKRKRHTPHCKTIKFGTNVDLSHQKNWKVQLMEMDKLPQFIKVSSRQNMLTYLGYQILGMNSVQLYMKVPGCRTPGHQENNNFCSVNINVGPGDCEWFGVHVQYWQDIEKLCKKNKVDYLKGSWWPIPEDLYALDIPLYRFVQKPGDTVFVNVGTVHWVQSLGWCNNIAWNVGPITKNQYNWAVDRYNRNKIERFRSIVPMILLSWNIAKSVKVKERELREDIQRVLQQSMRDCRDTLVELENNNIAVRWHEYVDTEPAFYCYQCQEEVFNILFAKLDNRKHRFVYCKKCARDDNGNFDSNFAVLQQFKMKQLQNMYESFVGSDIAINGTAFK